MAVDFSFFDGIKLKSKKKISKSDAVRQEQTATEILDRLKNQPGVILADEVGMGKTFVALAVAISAHFSDKRRRPIVVMVPSSLKGKWPRDFDTFKNEYVEEKYRDKLTSRSVEKSEEFLRLADRGSREKVSVIFLTHGAMARGLTDPWLRLALIQRSLHGRKNIDAERRSVARFAGKLLQLKYLEREHEDLFENLLRRNPSEWRDYLLKNDVPYSDSPKSELIPESVLRLLPNLDTKELFAEILSIPKRESQNLDQNLSTLRRSLNSLMKKMWSQSVHDIEVRLPLLILDEAHHLKNASTRTASLFMDQSSEEDADEISRGALVGAFDRMLFLTATPFQLGHNELIQVLERFTGINWSKNSIDEFDRSTYQQKLNELRDALDRSQASAIRLDRVWGRLKAEDLICGDKTFNSPDEWWTAARPNPEKLSPSAKQALGAFVETKQKMSEAQILLQPWIIRHTKSRKLEGFGGNVLRRQTFEGAAIENHEQTGGLKIQGDSLLPFLLAARAVACSPETRPVFAEGLASSYEAFLNTRKNRLKDKVIDDEFVEEEKDELEDDQGLAWYMQRIAEALPTSGGMIAARHPKIQATVDRALATWVKGGKVLIFCHYIATGRALRQAISVEISNRIIAHATERTGLTAKAAARELELLGERFFKAKEICDEVILNILTEFPDLVDHHEKLADVVRRMLRTPSFLVRFFPLKASNKIDKSSLLKSFAAKDDSGQTFEQILRGYFKFLSEKSIIERQDYIDAVGSIQTGSHLGADVEKTFSSDERQAPHEKLVANVRLANGEASQTTRQKLMLTFNTPFYPEVLIASSVMAEGVDLHLNCRHVIHHDLSWNPSLIEQRTGRVDRLGAKVEQCGESIQVYLPYVAETQDEKMFRVVTDRERWFKVVMGEKYSVDARAIEAMAARVPFPLAAAEELAFKLESSREN